MKATFPHIGMAGRVLFGLGLIGLLTAAIASYLGQCWNGVFYEVTRLKTNQVIEEKISSHFEQGRYSLWEYIATGDEESYRRAQQAFSLAEDRVRELQSRTFSLDRRVRLDHLATTLSEYEGLVVRFEEVKDHAGAADLKSLTERATALGNQMESQGEALSAAYQRAATEKVDAGSGLTDGLVRQAAWLGFGAIFVGALLSVRLRRRAFHSVAAAE